MIFKAMITNLSYPLYPIQAIKNHYSHYLLYTIVVGIEYRSN